ncbi:hypothetical protein WMY93_016935 [Mugilogobius chulae]|uniref:Protein kinase domain-containing protein n=1 Tax=Mugilogobius chulae TaxID=88201 RepID=A0AAW0NN15_9GOBI
MTSNMVKEITINIDDIISGDFGAYQIKELKGEGSFGKVARCVDISTNQNVAVKIARAHLTQATKHEAHVLRMLSQLSDDKNIVKFISSFEYKGHYCLVMENLDQSLYNFMEKRSFQPLNLPEIRYITGQLLVAFKELSKLQLVHVDLKPDNVMLVNHKLYPFKVKLIDFGISTCVAAMAPGSVLQAVGYRAPEISLFANSNGAVDMWALGCVMAFLYLGQNLFPCNCEYQMMTVITRMLGMPEVHQLRQGLRTRCFFKNVNGHYQLNLPKEYTMLTGKIVQPCRNWSTAFTSLENMAIYHRQPVTEAEKEESRQFINFMKEMLQVNPAKRITPEKALQHPFITQKKVPKRQS